jgi:hypothetical protein
MFILLPSVVRQSLAGRSVFAICLLWTAYLFVLRYGLCRVVRRNWWPEREE